MSGEGRALRWAKDVWRESPASENEIERGVDRVAQRFVAPRRTFVPRRAWKVAGVTAVLGALAYTTRGGWLPRHAPSNEAPPAPIEPRVELPVTGGTRPLTPAAVEPPAPPEVPAAEPAPLAHPSSPDKAIDKKRRTAPAVDPAPPATEGPDTTWVEVSEALAARDHDAAERLLLELANGRHDANTRAKAHLGLAQLDESKNRCESARKHALIAASIPDIEIKTVRRALELAARCAR
jgi:hypothetical protein